MTYRQAFDHLGRPYPQACNHKQTRQRVYRAALARWMLAVLIVLAWAALTGWMEMPK